MVLQEISEDIFYKSNLRALDFWMFELPLLSYFNLKYFKFKIYLHHFKFNHLWYIQNNNFDCFD